jgi:tetratricopeptide (TPR) repeat protein
MQYAHDHNIIHRDLKPPNVLLTKAGVLKISDFGLAKQLESDSSQTRTGTIMGTPSYMAPEQGRGEKTVGPLADVYALGSMLYEMITGRPPFLAETAFKTLMRLLKEEPVPPSRIQPGVSRDLETICLKCLQKDPGRRYDSAAALADDLRRFQAGETILARPVGRPEKAWRWCKRNPRLAMLYGMVGVLFVAVGASLAVIKVRADRERETQAENEKRELAAREQMQRQIAEARRQAQQRLEQATEAVSSGNFRKAQDLLLGSDPILSSAAELSDLRRQLAELDGQIKTYADFRSLFDNARYLGLFGGPGQLLEARKASHELIALYDLIDKREGAGEFGWPPLNDRQKELLQEDIFEALLVASKIEGEAALAGAGHTPEAAAAAQKAATQQAIDWLNRAETILPPTRALYVWRSGYYKSLGDAQAEAADVERLKKIEPTSAVDRFWHAFADSLRAEEFLNQKKDATAAANSYRLAAAGYAKVVEARPEKFWAYFNWAQCLTKLGDRYGALVGYTTCIRLNPEASWAYKDRGFVHLQLREFDLAIADIETAIRLNPSDAAGYLRRAEYYSGLKDFARAQADCTTAIELAPDDPISYLRRGEACFPLKEFDKARDDFTAAIRLKPNDVAAYRNRAVVSLLGKNLDGSLADWQELTKLAPASHEPHYYIGAILLGRQELEPALTELETAIKLKPTDGQSHMARAMVYRWQGRFDAALAELNLVLTQLVPNRHDYIIERADLYRALGKFDEALDDYQKCLGLQPRQIDGYLGLAYVYDQMGKPAQARDAYERMAKADPALPAVYLRRAEYLLNRGEFDAAAADRDQAGQIDPQSVLPGLVRAEITAARGEHVQAVNDAEALLAKAPPHDGKVLYAAACVYSLAAKAVAARSGDPDSAKLREEYSQRAIQCLKEVVGTCFHDLEYPDHNRMAWDPAFQSIRALPEFEKLLSGRK